MRDFILSVHLKNMKKTSHTKQEHFIPRQSYLEYFTDKTDKKPFVWVYESPRGLYQSFDTAIPKQITPFNLCKINSFYETPKSPVNLLEQALAKIEGDYKSILETKILNRIELSEEEKQKVALFISTLEARTPTNKQHYHKFIDDVLNLVKSNEEQFIKGKKSKLHEELDQGKEENTFFAISVATAIDLNRWRFSDFLFLNVQYNDDDQFFISSDFPVFQYDFAMMNSFYGVPPNSATIEVTVPLTSQIALLVNNCGFNGYASLDHNMVRELKNRTFNGARGYLLAHKKVDKTFVVRCTDRYRQSFLLHLMSKRLQNEDFERKSKKYKIKNKPGEANPAKKD